MSLLSLFRESAQEAGCSDLTSLEALLQEAAQQQHSLIDTALDSNLVPEELFLQALSRRLGLPWCSQLSQLHDDSPSMREQCPAKIALRHRIYPLQIGTNGDPEKKIMTLVTYDPFDLLAKQDAARQLPFSIHWQMASRKRILHSLQELYGVGADTFEQLLAGLTSDGEPAEILEEANILDAADDEEASVVKFVNQIIREALSQRATDIHVEPLESNLRIRYRIDGVLQEVPVPENIKALQASVIARLKIMSRLDIAEKRLPQDGRIHLQLGKDTIDVRVATIPTVSGESVSLRLLGQEKFSIDRLDLEPDTRQLILQLLQMSNGIILVTGPTGCGKSTSLYTFLSLLNTSNRRIVTVEDPVENKLEGVMQIAVRPEIGLSFATGLRSILRSDPNVIMVGEIRDLETAEIAIRASLTGHLVFSTLHTNDAVSAITRLTDMGIEPFLVGAAVRAFIAQRLVRKLCPSCKQPHSLPAAYLEQLQFPLEHRDKIFTATGCEVCRHSGYYGRLALYEICPLSASLQDMIVAHQPTSALREQARRDGMRSLRDYGWEKVRQGITSVEEVVRVTTSQVDVPED